MTLDAPDVVFMGTFSPEPVKTTVPPPAAGIPLKVTRWMKAACDSTVMEAAWLMLTPMWKGLFWAAKVPSVLLTSLKGGRDSSMSLNCFARGYITDHNLINIGEYDNR